MRRCGVALLGLVAIALTACGSDDDGEETQPCRIAHIVSVDATSLEAPGDCGVAPVSDQVDITTSGTVATFRYQTQLWLCGGTVKVVLASTGSDLTRLSLVEDVEGGDDCTCDEAIQITVQVDMCEPGDYIMIIDRVEHPFTI